MIYQIKDSPDKRLRREKDWVGIIIHHTGDGGKPTRDKASWDKWFDNMTFWLTKKDDSYLSAHYIISRTGRIIQMVDPDTHESFHAGKSAHWHPIKRKVLSDWNAHSIGIELIGDGNNTDYDNLQYDALIDLCKFLIPKYNIHPLCILGHENVATPDGRKDDPGKYFDWRRLFKGIYGG